MAFDQQCQLALLVSVNLPSQKKEKEKEAVPVRWISVSGSVFPLQGKENAERDYSSVSDSFSLMQTVLLRDMSSCPSVKMIYIEEGTPSRAMDEIW